MAQVKYSFDPETKRKILNSFYLSLLSAGGAFIASISETRDVKTSALIALSTGGAFLLNTIREYIAGKDKKQ
jgi:chemotaxis methyl-accepting protein methylase